MLDEYYKTEEEALRAQIQQQNEALCPVCKKNKLLQNKQVIFCGCGLRIDTKVRTYMPQLNVKSATASFVI